MPRSKQPDNLGKCPECARGFLRADGDSHRCSNPKCRYTIEPDRTLIGNHEFMDIPPEGCDEAPVGPSSTDEFVDGAALGEQFEEGPQAEHTTVADDEIPPMEAPADLPIREGEQVEAESLPGTDPVDLVEAEAGQIVMPGMAPPTPPRLILHARKLLMARRAARELTGIKAALEENLRILMREADLTFLEVDGVTLIRAPSGEKISTEHAAQWTPPDGSDCSAALLTGLGISEQDLASTSIE